MEIVEPRKIYENLAVRICALNTDQVFELPITSNSAIIH